MYNDNAINILGYINEIICPVLVTYVSNCHRNTTAKTLKKLFTALKDT